MKFLTLLLFCLLSVSQVYAATATRQSRDLGEAGDGLLGMVVNQTLSTNGYEFYRMFYLLWSEKAESLKYSLNVQERLSKRYGNQVTVSFGQKVVFNGVLPQKYDQLKALAEKAASETQANLAMLLIMPGTDFDISSDQV